MERQRDNTEEKTEEIKEAPEDELFRLRNELERLRELKQQKEKKEREAAQETTSKVESETPDAEVEYEDELDVVEKQLEEIDHVKFLQKPFTKDQLLGKVKEMVA